MVKLFPLAKDPVTPPIAGAPLGSDTGVFPLEEPDVVSPDVELVSLDAVDVVSLELSVAFPLSVALEVDPESEGDEVVSLDVVVAPELVSVVVVVVPELVSVVVVVVSELVSLDVDVVSDSVDVGVE